MVVAAVISALMGLLPRRNLAAQQARAATPTAATESAPSMMFG